MLQQISNFSKNKNNFLSAYEELNINGLLRKSNIKKRCGYDVSNIFRLLLSLVFLNKNLYEYTNSEKAETSVSKNTYYRFLSNMTYRWWYLLSRLALFVISFFQTLTGNGRVSCLVLDDTVFSRNRSKKVEYLSRIYDHANHKYLRGFSMVTLGWTDSFSFVPVDFALIGSSREKNIYSKEMKELDRRSYMHRKYRQITQTKPEVALNMIKNILNLGVVADFILMDSWYANEPLIQKIKELGLDVIGMVKNGRQTYSYKGKRYTLKELSVIAKSGDSRKRKASIVVYTSKYNIPVRIVFIKHRSLGNRTLHFISTDCSVDEDELLRIYGYRWQIEMFFKSVKSKLGLASELQCRYYSAICAHTTIVFTRFIILEWLRRKENDERTLGGLFLIMCDEVKDMDLKTAIQNIALLLMKTIVKLSKKFSEEILRQVKLFFFEQPRYIQEMLGILKWES